PAPGATAAPAPFAWRRLAPSLAAYLLFGLGYTGYMTFVVTLLREEGLSGALIVAFYTLLGLGVMASSWLWAGLLQRQRGGRALALLNALLALATVLPVLAGNVAAIFASGALFGAVFLSVVASTTALVRHNVEAAAWPAGIAAYTSVFALGQIAGPALVGAIADAAGGLRPGLGVSAAVLAAAALLAWLQKPSHKEPRDPP
ncbi:MAG: YbfB/YjiJ family MFS transporter, partial [Betaproteobacteria bacterium]